MSDEVHSRPPESHMRSLLYALARLLGDVNAVKKQRRQAHRPARHRQGYGASPRQAVQVVSLDVGCMRITSPQRSTRSIKWP